MFTICTEIMICDTCIEQEGEEEDVRNLKNNKSKY